MQYLAYSQPPTSVTEAHKADFLESGVDSVVQIKHNVIELHVLVASGLRLAISGTVQGVILKTVPVRLRSYRTSGLAVLTTTYQLFVVVFDKKNSQIRTLASHSVYERSAVKSVDLVALLAGSAEGESAPTPFLVLHAFQGLVRFIKLDNGKGTEAEAEAYADDHYIEPLDLSRGFVTRIPELLLNAMCVLPNPTGRQHRLATIHSNRHGQRVFHTHAINFASKSLDTYEPGTFDSPVPSFSPSSGITLFDADSQLMIPVKSAIAEGVLVVGSESALFFSTSTSAKSAGKRKSISTAPGSTLQETAMEVDELPEKTISSPKSKGKGRSVDTTSLTMSPTGESAPLPPSSIRQGGSRRRSSTSSSQVPLATSPTAQIPAESRSGNKRKLSDANSSGRGKGPTRTRSGSTLASMPVECRLPISDYVAYCPISDQEATWIVADSWGEALCVQLSLDLDGPASPASPAFSAKSAPLVASPGQESHVQQGRRLSRTSSGKLKAPFPLQLTVEPITRGRFSSPTALLNLGGGYIFVGSHYGDSLLVRLNYPARSLEVSPSKDKAVTMDVDVAPALASASIDVINTYTNLAPIVDFCIVETDAGEGPSHLVACSGGKNDGSLRIVRHGVAIAELASLEIDGSQRVFSLFIGEHDTPQNLLVVSSISDTRILSLGNDEEDEIEELDSFCQFDLSKPTLFACSYNSSAYQVTSTAVIGITSSWHAPQTSKITLASGHQQYILVAVSGGDVYLLDVSDPSEVREAAHTHFEQEVACLDLSSLDSTKSSLVVAVGLWSTYSVAILSVPDLEQLDSIDVGSAVLPRSVMSASLAESHGDSASYLFIGLGDGSLVTYSYGPSTASSEIIDRSTRKSVTLGNRPLALVKFRTAGNHEAGLPSLAAVLVISDRSTVVSATGNKLVYSSVNTKDIGSAVVLSSPAFPDSLLLATSKGLSIGRVEQLEKLDVQTLRLGEDAPRRVCHSSDMRAYGVAFLRETLDRKKGEVLRSSTFKVLGEDSFEVLLDFSLNGSEEARSVACLSLPEGESSTVQQQCFAVGTAFIEPDQEECTAGRILLFANAGEGQFELLAEAPTRGAVHAIGQLPNGRFVATSNSEVNVFDWDSYNITQLASWGATFIAYSLAIKSDMICVVDPMRSASLIRWDEERKRLVDVGKEFSAYGLFAAAFLRHVRDAPDSPVVDSIIAADLDLNLFTANNVRIVTTDGPLYFRQEVYTLRVQAMIHVGDVINKFASDGPVPQVIFCTSVGSIGMVASLPQAASSILSSVERNLRKYLETTDGSYSIGGLGQEEFRAFKAEYRTEPSAGFIDGALLETLLLLDDAIIDKVLQGTSEYEKVAVSKGEVVRLVEELQRMH